MSSLSKPTKPNQTHTNFMKRLQDKWELESPLQVLLILLVFSLAGTTAVMLRKSLFFALGYTEETNFWLKTFTYILFLFPAYQVLLLAYGFVFGQFRFFWKKEQKMLAFIRQKIAG